MDFSLNECLLRWSNVGVEFDERKVFSGFSGELRRGERLRIIGTSGAGKTTFFEILLGFVRPSDGEVVIGGDIRELAAYVPQEPDFGLSETAGEWLNQVFSYRRNRASRPSVKQIKTLCSQLKLSDAVLSTSVAKISGGERQRIAIIAALLLPRELMILDEPFSALDDECARAAAEAIVASGRTILYASHADGQESFATREAKL